MKQSHLRRLMLDGDWTCAYGYHWDMDPAWTTAAACDAAPMTKIPAKVPGNLELDLERAKKCPEIFYGDNVYRLYDCENMDAVYYRTFAWDGDASVTPVLVCEGLDCFAQLFVDGKKIGESANMLIPHEFTLPGLTKGTHELSIRFTSATIKAREHDVPVFSQAQPYSFESLYTRKAPHMYGWDIMCRAVSMGIWRHIYIESRPNAYIKDVFFQTTRLDGNGAVLKCNYNCHIARGDIREYKLRITGVCGNSVFQTERTLWHTGATFALHVPNAKLWWPHNYGDANLYHITAELFYRGEPVHVWENDTGIRTVQLDRTSTTNADGEGEFCFIVNGKRIFAMGSNWVPVDAYHSRDEERLPQILPMLTDIGCNIVRCWGGNVYENELFYDFCDQHGIMVWQDFAMACALYPQDDALTNAFKIEAETIVKLLRHHPSIVLWAGDNECDAATVWGGEIRDPNENLITRKILPEAIRNLDYTRPYLPSSPYMDAEAVRTKEPTSEDHLWGPRDYFKGDYYRNTVCHFASETGYHGCPSPESLAKYIPADHLWPCLDDKYWLCHAACMVSDHTDPFSYRIRLMWSQVETLFGKDGKATADLENFSRASQISQAEAKKYFIERFRLSKWRRTGIIWWNLIDGWPQISDAVVDYYGDKKLAYYYIKRSQKPFCLMFDEPHDGSLRLYAINDTRADKTFRYTIEDDGGKILAEGTAHVKSDTSTMIHTLPATDEKRYYIIRWDDGNEGGMNHYFANIRVIDYDYYLTLLEKLQG